MFNRRKFLGSSFLASTAWFLKTPDPVNTRNGERSTTYGQRNSPLVISTWDFGKAANAGAWEVLSKQGRALDAVEAGVRIPEADPTIHSIGYGGLPDRDGFVTLDACIMDEKSNCGAVMCLEHIVHPISVARLVMEKTPHVILAGNGALEFALANGFKKENLLTPESEKIWKDWLHSSKYEPVINIENKVPVVRKIMIRSECWRWILQVTSAEPVPPVEWLLKCMEGWEIHRSSAPGYLWIMKSDLLHLQVSEKKSFA